MKLVNVLDVMNPVRTAYRKKYGRFIEPDESTWINGLVDGINEIVAKGFRFVGVVIDLTMDCLYFEKSETKYVYTVINGFDYIRTKGADEKKMESMKNLHAVCYFWNLSRMHPYYFIAHELLDKPKGKNKSKGAKDYETMTGKKAKVAGKETKAFKDWKEKVHMP